MLPQAPSFPLPPRAPCLLLMASMYDTEHLSLPPFLPPPSLPLSLPPSLLLPSPLLLPPSSRYIHTHIVLYLHACTLHTHHTFRVQEAHELMMKIPQETNNVICMSLIRGINRAFIISHGSLWRQVRASTRGRVKYVLNGSV